AVVVEVDYRRVDLALVERDPAIERGGLEASSPVQEELRGIAPLARLVGVDRMRDRRLPDVQGAVTVDVGAVDAEAVRADPLAGRAGLEVASPAGAGEERVAGAERVEAPRLRDVREVAGAVVLPVDAPPEPDRYAVVRD